MEAAHWAMKKESISNAYKLAKRQAEQTPTKCATFCTSVNKEILQTFLLQPGGGGLLHVHAPLTRRKGNYAERTISTANLNADHVHVHRLVQWLKKQK